MIGRKPLRPQGYEPKVARTARPLSPGSNCALPHPCSAAAARSVARLLCSPVPIVALSARRSDAALALSLAAADPTTKNIQTQRNGFGTFVQKFQTVSGKSK